MIARPRNVLPRDAMTPMQIAAILGLEALMQATGLVILCPRCLSEGFGMLDTDNAPGNAIWKMDCRCRERRVKVAEVGRPLDADGELLANADQILAPLSLVIRCPEKTCIQHPLEIERGLDATIVRCRCAKSTIRLQRPLVH